jgi:molybdopterin-guanine dinucleotide biosynthesis protein A
VEQSEFELRALFAELATIVVPADANALVNVNTPADVEALR